MLNKNTITSQQIKNLNNYQIIDAIEYFKSHNIKDFKKTHFNVNLFDDLILFNNKVIGSISYNIGINIKLERFQIMKEYRRLGFGTSVLLFLLNTNDFVDGIVGESSPTAKLFYQSFKNVNIEDNKHDCAIYFNIPNYYNKQINLKIKKVK